MKPRIELFIDGTFYYKVSNYYRFQHARQRRIDLKSLMRMIETTGEQEGTVTRTRIYRGKTLTPSDGDRVFENYALRVGAEPIYLPTYGNPPEEKGVDVLLSLDAYEAAKEDRCEMVCLVTGDLDFLPLIRRIHRMGKKTMLVGFTTPEENPGTRTAYLLQQEVGRAVMLNMLIPPDSSDPATDHLFASGPETAEHGIEAPDCRPVG